jgi:hypothetical protein
MRDQEMTSSLGVNRYNQSGADLFIRVKEAKALCVVPNGFLYLAPLP